MSNNEELDRGTGKRAEVKRGTRKAMNSFDSWLYN